MEVKIHTVHYFDFWDALHQIEQGNYVQVTESLPLEEANSNSVTYFQKIYLLAKIDQYQNNPPNIENIVVLSHDLYSEFDPEAMKYYLLYCLEIFRGLLRFDMTEQYNSRYKIFRKFFLIYKSKNEEEDILDLFFSEIFFIRSLFYYRSGNNKQTLKLLKRGVLFADRHEEYLYNLTKAKLLNSLGIVNQFVGHLHESREFYFSAKLIYESLETSRGILVTTGNLADISILQGDLRGAKENFQNLETYFRKWGERHNLAGVLKSLGWIARIEGDFDQSIQYYDEALSIFNELSEKNFTVKTLVSLSETYSDILNFEKSVELLTQAEALTNPTAHPNEYFLILFKFFILTWHRSDNDLLYPQFARIESLYQDINKTQIITHQYTLIRVLWLLTKPSLSNLVNAQERLDMLFDSENLDFEILTLAIRARIQILLYEIKVVEGEEVISDIEEMLERIQNIATDTKSVAIKIHMLLINARIANISNDYNEALKILEEAKQLSSEYNSVLLPKIEEVEQELKRSVTPTDNAYIDEYEREKQVDFINEYLREVSRWLNK